MDKYNFTKEELIKAFDEAGSSLGAARLLNIKQTTYKKYCLKYDCFKTNQSGKGLTKVKKNVEKNEFDIHYFDVIDSNIKAYILGYTAADASIHSNTLRYNISSKDKEILEFIADQIHYDKEKIVNYLGYYKKDGIKHEFPCSALYLLSKHLVQTLEKYGIILNRVKKEINMFKMIDDKYKSAWISGYIDGNGSWSGYRVEITSNYSTIKEITDYLINKDNKIKNEREHKYFKTIYVDVNTEFINEYLSNDFILSRKRTKAIDMLNKKEKLVS